MQIKVTYSDYSTQIESAKLLFTEEDIQSIDLSIFEQVIDPEVDPPTTQHILQLEIDDGTTTLSAQLTKSELTSLLKLLRSFNHQL